MSLLSFISNVIQIDRNCIPRRQTENCDANAVDPKCTSLACSRTTSDAFYALSVLGIVEQLTATNPIFFIISNCLKNMGYKKIVVLNTIIGLYMFIFTLYTNASLIDTYNRQIDNDPVTESIVYIVSYICTLIYILCVGLFILYNNKGTITKLIGKVVEKASGLV